MKVVAVGRSTFIAGLQLAGVEGIEASSPPEALGIIKSLMEDKDVGLVIISDDFNEIQDDLADLRLKHEIPLVYTIPAPRSKRVKIEYRELIKRMLKIG